MANTDSYDITSATIQKEIDACIIWLKQQKFRKNISRKSPTSYGYKHKVERFFRDIGNEIYISENSFRIAADMLDIKHNKHFQYPIINKPLLYSMIVA